MVSKGIVQKIIDENYAEVCVTRQSACGENCASCSGCSKPNYTAVTIAKNTTDAKVGDTVNIKSETLTVIKGAVYVYILPIILFFVAFFIGSKLSFSENVNNILGIFGFSLGIFIAGLYSKKMAKTEEVSVEIF